MEPQPKQSKWEVHFDMTEGRIQPGDEGSEQCPIILDEEEETPLVRLQPLEDEEEDIEFPEIQLNHNCTICMEPLVNVFIHKYATQDKRVRRELCECTRRTKCQCSLEEKDCKCGAWKECTCQIVKPCQCNGFAHTECIRPWAEMNQTCHLCRRPFTKEALAKVGFRYRVQNGEVVLLRQQEQVDYDVRHLLEDNDSEDEYFPTSSAAQA